MSQKDSRNTEKRKLHCLFRAYRTDFLPLDNIVNVVEYRLSEVVVDLPRASTYCEPSEHFISAEKTKLLVQIKLE